MLILGHDHSASYSNTFLTDAAGRQVLTVNAGSKDLTRSVFRFSEDDKGALCWTLLKSDNLDLSDYEADRALEAKISPYAAKAEEFVNSPIGTLDALKQVFGRKARIVVDSIGDRLLPCFLLVYMSSTSGVATIYFRGSEAASANEPAFGLTVFRMLYHINYITAFRFRHPDPPISSLDACWISG